MLKRIAVHIEKGPAGESRFSVAAALAAGFQAQLLGIYVRPAPPDYYYDETVLPSAMRSVLEQRDDETRKRCEQVYRQRTAERGIVAEWREQTGSPEEVLPLHARCTDLLVIGQPGERTTDADLAPYQAHAIGLTAGRPVLMIPHAGQFPAVGERILFCWDHGREAARALSDAAPFLHRAREIVTLTLDPESDRLYNRQTVRGDLDAYFRAHGYVQPKSVVGDTDDVGIGGAILNTAADHSCDLIVMGLYGHSRAREWVLGGASREILASMTVPVLFSH